MSQLKLRFMKALVRRVKNIKMESPAGHKSTLNRVLIDSRSTHSKHFELIHGTVQPGGGSEYHSHRVESAFYILKGNAIAKIGGKKFRVGQGTALFTPIGTGHMLKCIGKDPLEILVIYSPHRTDKIH